ncbi:MAG: chitobiase/beta-hexosaminidase C-terminal domain-containing protein [Methanobacteriaceae archaeon]
MINKNKLFIFSILILLCAVAVPAGSAGTLSDGINNIVGANENIIAAADSLDEVNNPTNLQLFFVTIANTIKYNLDATLYGDAEANDGQYYMKFTTLGSGLNAMRISTNHSNGGEVKALTNNEGSGAGTVYIWDGGGTPNCHNMILLVSVKGPIDDDFKITIKSTGYSFAEGTSSGVMTYQDGITETFTKEDFIYGPQTTKPGGSALELYSGQNKTDDSSAEYFMFVDLHVGAVAYNNAIENGGTVKVEYSYENMYTHMSFNTYGWNSGSGNAGQGISWTNNAATRSYSVGYSDVTAPTVESSVATSSSFTAPFNVLLSGEDEAGSTSIYYTLDGGNPDKTNTSAIKYEGETITISKDTKLRVIAYDSAGNPSNEKEYDYNFIPTVTPSKSAGSFNSAFDLSLSVYDVGGDTELKYVIGDGDPSSGIDYTSPISIPAEDTTVKVYAKSENGIEYTETYVYTFDNTLPNIPTASVNTGLYNTNQNVVLTQGVNENDNTIYYTVDGSDPTNESTKYTGAIVISTTTTLKFIAYDNAGNPSNIVTNSYTIDKTAPNLPTASVNTGIYNSNKSVALSQATGETGNIIYYTLNGSDPTNKSTKYTGAIAISKTSTLKFIAYDSAGNPSNVVTKTYTINTNVPKVPTSSVNTGTYNSNKNVVLKQATGETANTIYYTTNGANPTSKSTKYTGAIAISKTSTLKFIAYNNAGTPSSVVTRTYTIDKTKPKVTSNVPKNSATKVSKTSAITIKFNEKVVKGSGWNNIYVKNLKTGKKIKITSKTLSKDGKTLTIKTSSRATNVKYDVVVPANAVKDLATNSLSKLLKFIFRSR